MSQVKSAGIIAAGEGQRFRKAGILTPKPLIEVAGEPLIGRTLGYYEKLGIRRVVIIFNEQEADCVAWVSNWAKRRLTPIRIEFIVKSTASSFESFGLVGQTLGPGRHLMSTVDSVCSPVELEKMAQDFPGNGVYLGLSQFVDDEKPLWVNYIAATQAITSIGGSSGTHVTAGFYNVPHTIFDEKPQEPISSLRVFLKWLQDKKIPFYGVPLQDVVDIDHPKDLQVAEEKLRQWNTTSKP